MKKQKTNQTESQGNKINHVLTHVTSPKTSKINDCYIKTRNHQTDTLFYQSSIDDDAFYVNLESYLIIPIETPLNEIAEMQKQHKKSKEYIPECDCDNG